MLKAVRVKPFRPFNHYQLFYALKAFAFLHNASVFSCNYETRINTCCFESSKIKSSFRLTENPLKTVNLLVVFSLSTLPVRVLPC